jgi:hypothetical protein
MSSQHSVFSTQPESKTFTAKVTKDAEKSEIYFQDLAASNICALCVLRNEDLLPTANAKADSALPSAN